MKAMMRRVQAPLATCGRCGYRAPERAFRFEVALSADDSGDNDWVVNHLCPRCECASPPVLDAGRSPKRPSGHRTANAQYDPSAP